MKIVDKGYDKMLWSNYELGTMALSELKELARGWYGDLDLSKFDNRKSISKRDEDEFIEMRRSGITSNYFFAYRDQSDNYYLMDGFNRLFSDYGDMGDLDCPVYIKVITDELEDWQLMHIMFRLNMWKLQGSGHWAFDVKNFFDRGFRLFLYKKFNIILDNNKGYNRRDFDILNKYFRSEWSQSDAFPHRLPELGVLMSRERIVDDIKYLLETNDKYDKGDEPFGNFTVFLSVFIIFMSARRVENDMSDYSFDYYIEELHKDTKFFKKFTKMSGTDSTRQNAYKWIREVHEKNSEKQLAK